MTCPTCGKPPTLCPCPALAPLLSRIAVVVLQHPQEQRELLGTGLLVRAQVPNAVVKVGLSWPNLHHILGREVDPKRWATLYLGAAKDFPKRAETPLILLDRNGRPVAAQPPILRRLEGLIVLDGTWAQAKTLWWRNPWLVKSWRLVINPARPSLYGTIRREPRREGLSTLEAVAFCLSELEGKPDLYQRLTAPLALLLEKYRGQAQTAAGPETAEPTPVPAASAAAVAVGEATRPDPA